jgi:hypothetical protein
MIRLIIVAAIAAIFLPGCNRQVVSLSYTNAKDEVPQLGNLVFRFNHPLVPDSMLNVWDSTKYISFAPAIEGRFRWEHPDELVFSPAKPLMPATTYSANFERQILANSKFDKVSDEMEVRFNTADLHLENSNTFWRLAIGAQSAEPQIDLYFNYPVKPSALQEKMKVTVDEKEMDYKIETLSAQDKVSVHIAGLKTEDRDYKISIHLDKGSFLMEAKMVVPKCRIFKPSWPRHILYPLMMLLQVMMELQAAFL